MNIIQQSVLPSGETIFITKLVDHRKTLFRVILAPAGCKLNKVTRVNQAGAGLQILSAHRSTPSRNKCPGPESVVGRAEGAAKASFKQELMERLSKML